jgi:ankyrin repeat protein
MVAVLLELGADPLAGDGSGFPASAYAISSHVDRSMMERVRAGTTQHGEGVSPGGAIALLAALALGEWETAEGLLKENPNFGGVLHMMAKRNDLSAVKWLLSHGADPNIRWAHWDAEVTPLHLAAAQGHVEVVRLLLQAGADPRIHDSKHDSDALGWATHFGRREIVEILKAHMEVS